MQLPTSLPSDYSKSGAIDMTNPYYSEHNKYSSPPVSADSIPYSVAANLPTPDNAGLVAAGMFPRFPLYDAKPGYEPEGLSTTEAFMRSYSTSSSGSCPNPYSPQDRLPPSVHPHAPRGIQPGSYPPQSVMSNGNPAGVPIFPWMRSNISGRLFHWIITVLCRNFKNSSNLCCITEKSVFVLHGIENSVLPYT